MDIAGLVEVAMDRGYWSPAHAEICFFLLEQIFMGTYMETTEYVSMDVWEMEKSDPTDEIQEI